MIYTTDIIGYQWELFLKSVALGLLLAWCYDVLRIFRTVIKIGKKLFAASDFVFCIWAGFLIFSFLLNENFGMPRFYIYVGIGFGFTVWYFTIGKLSMAFAKFLRRFLKAILKPFLKIFQKSFETVKNRVLKTKIICEKAICKPKKLLKNKAGLVYNILCLNVSKAFLFCGKKAGKEPEIVESNGTEKTETGTFSQDRSYCLRGVSSLFSDIDAGEHNRKTR